MKKFKLSLTFLVLFLSCQVSYAWADSLRVARIFSDNMVLQQGIYAPVWGWASPGTQVTVEVAGGCYTGVADETGKWLVRIAPKTAGGPYELKVRCGSKEKVYSNVMFGEVWLASGQSNMNFRLASVQHAAEEVQHADYPDIREFATPYVVSRTPLQDLSGGSWQVCTPQTAGDFSAVAYFFARALHIDRKVPVGIIHTSWSGTVCEAWISAGMLHTLPEFRNRVVEEIYNSDEDWASLHQLGIEKDKERARIVSTSDAGLKQRVHTRRYDDSSWKTAPYPVYPARVGLGGYKLLWLRKEIELPAEAMGKDLMLHLGKVIRSDVTYFNGVEVGRSEWDGVRTYRVPAKLLKKGRNVIAVRLLSEWGYGRLGDEASTPRLYSQDQTVDVALDGTWKFNGSIEPELPVGKGYSNNITCMYNTKIAPLVPYGLRGFLWYQGEGNSGNPDLYERMQPTLINDWRIRFGQGSLPFLFVQLPNIDGGNWQRFREAQAKSLDWPDVGMAVSIDVGDPYDIHPKNKKVVGERLYSRAKELAYKESDGVFQGPVCESFRIEGNKICLTFNAKTVGSGLVSKDGNELRTFEVAGKDGRYVPAQAVIDGCDVIVWSDSVQAPCYARHAWSPNPVVNLYNREGFPATSFRMGDGR